MKQTLASSLIIILIILRWVSNSKDELVDSPQANILKSQVSENDRLPNILTSIDMPDSRITFQHQGFESRYRDVIRLISEGSVGQGGQYLKLTRLINNYIAYWISYSNGKFFYHRVELSVYDRHLRIESALTGSQSLNLSADMLHRCVFRGIKEFLDYMIIASYDRNLDSYFFTFADGQSNLVNFNLPSLNNKIKFLRNSSKQNQAKINSPVDSNFSNLNILVDYKDREKSLDVFMLLWFNYGNTVLFIDHNLQTQKFNTHKFFSMANFSPEKPLNIKILKNKSILLSQDNHAYIIPQQVFFANYKKISSIANNFYVRFPMTEAESSSQLNNDLNKSLDHVHGEIFYRFHPSQSLTFYRMIVNDKKIVSFSTVVDLKLTSMCRDPMAVPIVVSSYYGCLIKEGDDMAIYVQSYKGLFHVLTAIRINFLKGTKPSEIQIKESLNKDYLIFASLHQVTVIFYSDLRISIRFPDTLPVFLKQPSSIINELFANDRIEELYYLLQGEEDPHDRLNIINNDVEFDNPIVPIQLLPRLKLEYNLSHLLPKSAYTVEIFEIEDKNGDVQKSQFKKSLSEAIQIKRFKFLSLKAKVTIGHITNLMGVEIKIHNNISTYKLIASSQNINNFLTGSTVDEALTLKRGIIDKMELLNYFYIGNRVYTEYATRIGYFEFETSNNFIEVKKHLPNYQLVQPLAFDSSTPFLLYLFNEKIEIYQGSQFISYANFPTRENYRNLPMVRSAYDELTPNYFFFLLQPDFLHYAEMLIMTFIHVEVKSIALPRMEGQILAFKTFQKYLIFLNYAEDRFILRIFELDTESRTVIQVKGLEITASQCRTPFYELVYGTSINTMIEVSAKFVFCSRHTASKTEKLYYVMIKKKDCCRYLELFPELPHSEIADRLFQISKIRTLNSFNIQEKLIIFESADRINPHDLLVQNQTANALNKMEKITKPSKDTNVSISIYTLYDDHSLEVDTSKYFDQLKNGIMLQIAFHTLKKSHLSRILSLELSNSCMTEEARLLEYKTAPRNLVFHIINNEGTITAEPLYIFNGEIFEYRLELSNSFENFFNMIKIEDILRLVNKWSIPAITKAPYTGGNVQVQGNFLHIYNPITKIYGRYNFAFEDIMSSVNVETTCPEPNQLQLIYRNFYLSHGYILLVYKDNYIQIAKNYKGSHRFFIYSEKLDYKERIYEAKGYVQDNLITIFAKTNPFDVNFSIVLLLRESSDFKNKMTIQLLNQQFQKITYQQIVVLNFRNIAPVIIHRTQRMGLLLNFLPDISFNKSGSIITSKYVPIYVLFKNEPMIRSLTEQFDSTKLKCFNHKSLESANPLHPYVTCIAMFPKWHFLKVSFEIVYSDDINVNTVAFNIIENFPYEANLPYTFRKAVISDKFIVTAFIVNRELTLYVYNAPVSEIKGKPNLITVDIWSSNDQHQKKQIDFCDEQIKEKFMNPFRKFALSVDADTLDFFELNDECLEFIVNGDIYRYNIYSEINGSLKKYNLLSKQITLYAINDKKNITFVQENVLHENAQTGCVISVQGP